MLRGASIISPVEGDEEKTIVVLMAHMHTGGSLPDWVIRASVNGLAPVEPFRIMYKIEKGTKEMMKEEEKARKNVKKGDTSVAFVSHENEMKKRPGGMSQMGHASFWPEGGGLVEKGGESWKLLQPRYWKNNC